MSLLLAIPLALLGLWCVLSWIICFVVASKLPGWSSLSPLTRIWITLYSPIGVPLKTIRDILEERATKRKVLRIASSAIARSKVDEGTVEVDTIEGLRAMASSPQMAGRRIVIQGEFDITTPIEITSPVFLDLGQATFNHQGCPVFWAKVPGILLKDFTIVSETDLIPAGDSGETNHNDFAILVNDGASTVIMGYNQKGN